MFPKKILGSLLHTPMASVNTGERQMRQNVRRMAGSRGWISRTGRRRPSCERSLLAGCCDVDKLGLDTGALRFLAHLFVFHGHRSVPVLKHLATRLVRAEVKYSVLQ